MSYQNNNLIIPFNNNINNINLISLDKSPNQKLNIIINQENNNPNNLNIKPSNDLLKSKNEEGSNLSNINIDQEQKFIENADFLFGDSDNEKENIKQNPYSNYNNNNHSEISDDSSINEEKRIEIANNLFDTSLTVSKNSHITNNDISRNSINTINYEKRKEVADKLFESQSDISSKLENINVNNLNKSIKSNKTNMSNFINNLTGSNVGLNINELANKFADRDKMIYESIHSNDNDFMKKSNSEKNIDENIKIDEDEGIEFNENLIEFKDKNNYEKINKLNNLNKLGNLSRNNNKNKNNNNSSSLKNELIQGKKKLNNKLIINISDNNINNMDENTEKKEEQKINKNNIIDESIIRESNEMYKKEKNKNDKPQTFNGANLKELFSKNKKERPKNEKIKLYMEEKFSEEQNSNEILVQKKEKEKNKEKGKEKNKREIKIIDDIDDNNISIKGEKDNNRKSELINKEIKETNNDSSQLITDKSNLLKGRNKIINENESKKFIQIQRKKKDEEINKNDNDNKLTEIENDNNINIINNINNSISFEEEKNIVHFNREKFTKEKRFKNFLKENHLYFNDKIYNKKENEIQIEEIKSNSFYPKCIYEQETFFDEINKENKKKKGEIILYYNIMKETYEKNKSNFNLLFQSVNNEDKEKIFKLYKNFENYNIKNNYISPHLNDIKSFINTFLLKLKKNHIKNIDYIRYSLNENNGDTFYRCFIFNLFEKKIINKDKEYIYMIIFDLLKIYDLSPNIFNSEDNINNNINDTLVFFDILRDYIELNSWDKVYEFFFGFFSQINQILIKYIKYNIFLLLSKLYSLNEDNPSYDNPIYLNQYQKILIDYNEPSKIIFQLITIIFGVNLEIIYIENKEETTLMEQTYDFDFSKFSKNENNKIDKLQIINYNNCYHIGYKKKDLLNNKEIFNSIKENINEISLIQFTKKGKIKCDECKNTTEFIEINNENNNKGICSECLNKEIEIYLLKRISYIKEDNKKNYINYSYYLRPIEILLQEPLSIKNGIEDNSIIIKNIDYYLLYQNTFTQKIKELFSASKEEEVSNNNNIINTLSNSNRDNKNNLNDNDLCMICAKDNNVLVSSCGCKICDDCIYTFIDSITNNQIILNGYEKKQLYEQDLDKCPLCEQKISLSYLIMLLQTQGRNFENETEEAITRMSNYCQTICFNCLQKYGNEDNIEVEHNKNKKMIKLNVQINKHLIKEAKKNKNKNKDENYENEYENGIDYNDAQHCLCIPCYKKVKIKRTKKLNEENYNVVGCNICGVNHLINIKDWNRVVKNDVCCKCDIF